MVHVFKCESASIDISWNPCLKLVELSKTCILINTKPLLDALCSSDEHTQLTVVFRNYIIDWFFEIFSKSTVQFWNNFKISPRGPKTCQNADCFWNNFKIDHVFFEICSKSVLVTPHFEIFSKNMVFVSYSFAFSLQALLTNMLTLARYTHRCTCVWPTPDCSVSHSFVSEPPKIEHGLSEMT